MINARRCHRGNPGRKWQCSFWIFPNCHITIEQLTKRGDEVSAWMPRYRRVRTNHQEPRDHLCRGQWREAMGRLAQRGEPPKANRYPLAGPVGRVVEAETSLATSRMGEEQGLEWDLPGWKKSSPKLSNLTLCYSFQGRVHWKETCWHCNHSWAEKENWH